MDMKKIGVLNCSHIYNFGSVLQSYAMEKIIANISGYETKSIRYNQKKDLRYVRNYFPQLFEKEIVTMKLKNLKRKAYLKYLNKELADNIKKREKCFQKFVDSKFNFTKIYTDWYSLCESVEEFAGFVLGSDQVWHPINLGSHFYTMEWIPDNIPKIAYASSFGVSAIPRRQEPATKNYLKHMDAISVREKAGSEIIKKLTGKNVPVVLDPTFLLSEIQWREIAEPIHKKGYIFCYFLGNNISARKYALQLKKETGLNIVCIPFMDEINKCDIQFGDIRLFEVNPTSFLSYIINAEYVVTDSFHGTVFSVIFQKQFVVFNRFADNRKLSTNSRIDTLLETLEITRRRILIPTTTKEAVRIMTDEIDYKHVMKKLKELCNDSLDYLVFELKKQGMTKD